MNFRIFFATEVDVKCGAINAGFVYRKVDATIDQITSTSSVCTTKVHPLLPMVAALKKFLISSNAVLPRYGMYSQHVLSYAGISTIIQQQQ